MLSWELFSIQPKGNKIAANRESPNHFRTPVVKKKMMMIIIIIIIIIIIYMA